MDIDLSQNLESVAVRLATWQGDGGMLVGISDIDGGTLQDMLIDHVEYGPQSMVAPIEAEFARRGISDPYSWKAPI